MPLSSCITLTVACQVTGDAIVIEHCQGNILLRVSSDAVAVQMHTYLVAGVFDINGFKVHCSL